MTLLANINLKDNPNLIRLLLPGETLEARHLLYYSDTYYGDTYCGDTYYGDTYYGDTYYGDTYYGDTSYGRAYPVDGEMLGPCSSRPSLSPHSLRPATHAPPACNRAPVRLQPHASG
jgi:hypothetical protein